MSFFRSVKNVVQKRILPIIETAALTSVGVPAPVAAGIVNYANGGNIQSAIAAGAGQYLGTQATEFAGDQGVPAPIAQGIGSAVKGTVTSLGSGQNLPQEIGRAHV